MCNKIDAGVGNAEQKELKGDKTDRFSVEEEISIARKNYDLIESGRNSHLRGVFYYGLMFLVAVTIVCYAVSIFIWFYHLWTPEHRHFALPDNLDKLQSILFGSITGGFVTQFVSQFFNNKR